jgi:sugar phosphate permease
MRLGIIVLILAYGMSQFFRAFMAVLAPTLTVETGASVEQLATASGVWFLTFAAMQIPIGEALDRIGPKLTASVLFAVGGAGGAALFSMATAPWHITAAMGLIGIGCAPVLMASYFIFARTYSPAVFASLAAMMVGLGSLGNIMSSAPLAWAVEAFGWRPTVLGLAVLTLTIALLILAIVKNPEQVTQSQKGSVLDVLKIPALWPILIFLMVIYVPAAALRGLWSGPYLQSIFNVDGAVIGNVTFFMAMAMIVGSFAYGPLDRVFGTRKWIVWVGNFMGMLACAALAIWPDQGLVSATILLSAIGFFGASYPMIMAHGRGFLPPHLVGRGVTLMNLCSIGAVGLIQTSAKPLTAALWSGTETAAESYGRLFAFFAALLAAGLIVYLWSKDTKD